MSKEYLGSRRKSLYWCVFLGTDRPRTRDLVYCSHPVWTLHHIRRRIKIKFNMVTWVKTFVWTTMKTKQRISDFAEDLSCRERSVIPFNDPKTRNGKPDGLAAERSTTLARNPDRNRREDKVYYPSLTSFPGGPYSSKVPESEQGRSCVESTAFPEGAKIKRYVNLLTHTSLVLHSHKCHFTGGYAGDASFGNTEGQTLCYFCAVPVHWCFAVATPTQLTWSRIYVFEVCNRMELKSNTYQRKTVRWNQGTQPRGRKPPRLLACSFSCCSHYAALRLPQVLIRCRPEGTPRDSTIYRKKAD